MTSYRMNRILNQRIMDVFWFKDVTQVAVALLGRRAENGEVR